MTETGTQSTLDAMASIIQTALTVAGSAVKTIYTEPQTVPYRGTFPVIILNEYHDYFDRIFTGVKGNADNTPSIYTIIYLQASVAAQQAKSLASVVRNGLRPDIDTIKRCFLSVQNQQLYVNGASHAIMVGDMLHFEGDPDGPFINYLGQPYVGLRGLISVIENVRYDTQP